MQAKVLKADLKRIILSLKYPVHPATFQAIQDLTDSILGPGAAIVLADSISERFNERYLRDPDACWNQMNTFI